MGIRTNTWGGRADELDTEKFPHDLPSRKPEVRWVAVHAELYASSRHPIIARTRQVAYGINAGWR